MEIPIYGIKRIDETEDLIGVFAFSVTGNPANQMSWVALSDELESIKLNSDEVKQTVTGVALIPGQKILRKDPETGNLFYLVYSEEDIYTISQLFFKRGYTHNTTEEHLIPLDKNFITESWLIGDPKVDKAVAMGFSGLPKGTWMVTYKITDKVYFTEEILSGKKVGFSIEGLFQIDKENPINNKINLNQLKMDNKPKGFLANLKALFTRVNLSEITLEDGTIMSVNDETGEVMINNEVPKDGDYVDMDGETVYEVTNGVITAVKTKEVAVDMAEDVVVDETPAVDDTMKSDMDALSLKVDELVTEVATLKTQLDELMKTNKDIIESISMTKISMRKLEEVDNTPKTLLERLALNKK